MRLCDLLYQYQVRHFSGFLASFKIHYYEIILQFYLKKKMSVTIEILPCTVCEKGFNSVASSLCR